MTYRFKSKKRLEDWRSASVREAGDNSPSEFRLFLADPRELRQFYGDFNKFMGKIRGPQPSAARLARRTSLGFILSVALADLFGAAHESKNRIFRPPGSFLGSIAEFVFSRKTVELVVTPIISDLQVEYCEALAADRKVKAGWVRLRGYWSLFKALGLYSIVKMFFEMWRKLSAG